MDSYYLTNVKKKYRRGTNSRQSSKALIDNITNSKIFPNPKNILRPNSVDQSFFASSELSNHASTPNFCIEKSEYKKPLAKHSRKHVITEYLNPCYEEYLLPHISDNEIKGKDLKSLKPKIVIERRNKSFFKFEAVKKRNSSEKDKKIDKMPSSVAITSKHIRSCSKNIRKKLSICSIRNKGEVDIKNDFISFHQKSKDLLSRLKRSVFGDKKQG